MKQNFLLLASFLFLFSYCTQSEKQPQVAFEIPVELRSNVADFNRFIKNYEMPSQSFTVKGKETQQLMGEKGTLLFINPQDVETLDGKPVGETIEVELKEVLLLPEFITHDLQTLSDGKLLVSDGMYYVNLTSNGTQLKLKEGKTLKVQLSNNGGENMSLFYGRPQSGKVNNSINWLLSEQRLDVKKIQQFNSPEYKNKQFQQIRDDNNQIYYTFRDTLGEMQSFINQKMDTKKNQASNNLQNKREYEFRQRIDSTNGIYYIFRDTIGEPLNLNEQELVEFINQWGDSDSNTVYTFKNSRYYEPLELKSFGWINCDKFYNSKEELVTPTYKINLSDSIKIANIYVIFKEKTLIKSSCFYYKNKININDIGEIPANEPVKFFAIAYQDNKIYAAQTDFKKISKNKDEILDLKPISTSVFEEMMRNLAN